MFVAVGPLGVVSPARNPEVGQQDSLAIGLRVGEQDVGGLDVAVQQIALVRIVERIGHRRDDLGDLVRGHAVGIPLAEQPARVRAVDVVHRDPELAVELAAIVHADDVRAPQRCRDVGLPIEPLTVLTVGRHFVAQDLQRILAGESGMLAR